MFPKKGFTLVEMVLVTSLIAVISLALFHSLVNGLKVWEISMVYNGEEDASIFFDKISQDLRNATDYSLIKFDGSEDKLSFATIVKTVDSRATPQTEYISQIGKVEYEFDKLHNTLLRRQGNYGQAISGEFDPARPLFEAVKFVKFSYYLIDADRMVMKDRVPDGQWPVAVIVEIGFAAPGEQLNTMSKVISIPTGNYL